MSLGGFKGSIPQAGFKNFTVKSSSGGSPNSELGYQRQGLRLQGESATQGKQQESSGMRTPKYKGY